jgi:plasmid maintenance system killer protein
MNLVRSRLRLMRQSVSLRGYSIITLAVNNALRKLLILDAAETLSDLRSPPGNRLEKLVGDRAGEYSIRINEQWRICFRWREGDAYEVEIADYH